MTSSTDNPTLVVHEFPHRIGEVYLGKFKGGFEGGVRGTIVLNYAQTVHVDGRIFYVGRFLSEFHDGEEVVLFELTKKGPLPAATTTEVTE